MKEVKVYIAVILGLVVMAQIAWLRLGLDQLAELEKESQGVLREIPSALKELKDEVKESSPTVVIVNPYEDTKFTKTYARIREIRDIRNDDFGIGSKHQVKVTIHYGGKTIHHDVAWETVCAVLERMPNIKSTKELRLLCYETMIAETGLGKEKVSTGITKWKNYGIAQFRPASAKETLEWLKKVRPDVHQAVMDFYDQKLTLKENLAYNVPFSIAMMVQYYWRVVPDLYQNIGTRNLRAELWKSAYNTHKGAGTCNAYLSRVERHWRQFKIEI